MRGSIVQCTIVNRVIKTKTRLVNKKETKKAEKNKVENFGSFFIVFSKFNLIIYDYAIK